MPHLEAAQLVAPSVDVIGGVLPGKGNRILKTSSIQITAGKQGNLSSVGGCLSVFLYILLFWKRYENVPNSNCAPTLIFE